MRELFIATIFICFFISCGSKTEKQFFYLLPLNAEPVLKTQSELGITTYMVYETQSIFLDSISYFPINIMEESGAISTVLL